MSALLLVFVALAVAYANGANDNFKGVATLYGSGTTSYRGALFWGTFTTLAGSLCSAVVAKRLVETFAGRGLVPETLAGSPGFVLPVALGAALTLLLAVRLGLPISTTHALTGSLAGAGLAANAAAVSLSVAATRFFVPLAVSPLVAAALGAAACSLVRRRTAAEGADAQLCVCVAEGKALAAPSAPALLPVAAEAPALVVGTTTECAQRFGSGVQALRLPSLHVGAHYFSAGAASLARGLNDTPKIAGLLLILKGLPMGACLTLIGVAIAVGGILQGRRVALTMSRRITAMTERQAVVSNVVATLLVLTASVHGFPVSTTHVFCGALFGMGLVTRQADTRVIRQIVAAWVLTLPVATVLAAGARLVLWS